MLQFSGPTADLRLGAESRTGCQHQRDDQVRFHEFRSARSFAQYSSRFLISRSKPRSGGS